MEKIDNKIIKLKEIINSAKKIILFSGAGISVPSGIPDFRSSNGLYNKKLDFIESPEEIISHHYFVKNTENFYKYYKTNMIYKSAKPNIAHKYFAQLESDGKLIAVITQNIDGLHEMAGSKNVFNLHGTIHKNHCLNCGKFFDLEYILNSPSIPVCDKCGGIIKPDVVLYEETLDNKTTDEALKYMGMADVLIIVGTSLVVQPAASFVRYFFGNKIVLINKDSTPFDLQADLIINAPIEDVIKKLEDIT